MMIGIVVPRVYSATAQGSEWLESTIGRIPADRITLKTCHRSVLVPRLGHPQG